MTWREFVDGLAEWCCPAGVIRRAFRESSARQYRAWLDSVAPLP